MWRVKQAGLLIVMNHRRPVCGDFIFPSMLEYTLSYRGFCWTTYPMPVTDGEAVETSVRTVAKD